MVEFPSLHRYDVLTGALVVAILVVAHLLYPTHLVQVSAWLTILTIIICWLGFFIYRLVYEEVEF